MSNQYAQRDHRALGEHYLRHVSAMTGEGLHAKSDIAAELAWRDAEIERLRAAIEQHVAEEVAREREECARKCDAIEDQFNERERRTPPELRADAATGAGACGYALRNAAEELIRDARRWREHEALMRITCRLEAEQS